MDKVKLSLILILLVGSLALLPKVIKVNSPDFRVFHTASLQVKNAPSLIYRESPDRFLYPPIAALFFLPWSLAPFETAALGWYALQILLIFLIYRELKTRFTSPKAWLLGLLGWLVLSRYLVINLTYGQINLLILYLLLLASKPREFSAMSGTMLGLASVLKVFPVVGLAIDFFRGRHLKLFSTIAAITILGLFPFVIYGPTLAWDLHLQWLGQLADKGTPIYSHNQSLAALGIRLFSDTYFLLFATGEQVHWTLASLSPEFARILGSLPGFGLGILALFYGTRSKSSLRETSAIGFATLYLSHIVWKPYFIFLLPAVMELLAQKRWKILIPYVLLGPLMSGDLIGRYWADRWDGCSGHLLASLIVFWGWTQLKEKTTA